MNSDSTNKNQIQEFTDPYSDIANEAAMMVFQYRQKFKVRDLSHLDISEIVHWWQRIERKKYVPHFFHQGTVDDLFCIGYAFLDEWCMSYQPSKLVGDLLFIHIGGLRRPTPKVDVGVALAFIREFVNSAPELKRLFGEKLAIRKIFTLSVILRVVERWNIPCPDLAIVVPLEWGGMKAEFTLREAFERHKYLNALVLAEPKSSLSLY